MMNKPKRKIQGRDWHGWVCEMPDDKGGKVLCYWAEAEKPGEKINGGKWVRVKFIRVN